MINSDKANFKICGDYFDVIYELNQILEYFINEKPEILGGVLVVWNDKLKVALSKSDTCIELLDCTKRITERYVHLSEELENE